MSLFKIGLAVILYVGYVIGYALVQAGLSEPLVILVVGGLTLLVAVRFTYTVFLK